MCAHYIVKTGVNDVILFLTLSKKGKILVYRIELHRYDCGNDDILPFPSSFYLFCRS